MLVLLRKVGESIVIDGRVLVTVSKVRSTSVSLAIAAPEEVRVDRGEVHLRRRSSGGLAETSFACPVPEERMPRLQRTDP